MGESHTLRPHAGVAELADARDLKSELKDIAVSFKIKEFPYLSIISIFVLVPISSDKYL
jgi:hypothetical protein